MKNQLAILFTVMMMAACTSYVNPNNSHEVAAGIKVDYDNYKKIKTYSAPVMKQSHQYGITKHLGFVSLLAVKKDKTDEIIYSIHVRDTHFLTNWRFLDTAYDIDGNQLTVKKLGTNINCISLTCLREESIIILVSRTYLEQHQGTGIKFQVSGKNGQENYEVPAEYIQAFLSKVP